MPINVTKPNNNISPISSNKSINSGDLHSKAYDVIVMPTPDDDNNYDRFSKIQCAIDNVCPGGIVRVTNGEYHEDLIINKSIHLIGVDKNKTLITSTSKSTIGILVDANDVVINGFTIDGWEIGIDIGSSLFHVGKLNSSFPVLR